QLSLFFARPQQLVWVVLVLQPSIGFFDVVFAGIGLDAQYPKVVVHGRSCITGILEFTMRAPDGGV
ncbi:hypothetical protein ACWTQY_31715, partial [Klebsiella pneumoniae]